MKLVIFGLTMSSSWGNGHATLWRGLCRALQARGHLVTFFEKDVPYYASHRDLFELATGRLRIYPSWESVLPEARSELSDADVAMVTSYCPDAISATREVLDARGLRVFYDLDSPVTLSRLRSGRGVEYLGPDGLRGFDLVLSYTGGGALTSLRDELGAKQVIPLYGSVDPEVHKPAPPADHYRADLSYLGTYAEDRQAALNALFLETAREMPHQRFVLGGAQYPAEFPWTDNIFFVRHLPPTEHASFFCSSRLTLNVTRAAMAQIGFCPSGRLFEAAACGVPILSDTWEGLEQFFTPGREILVARETADVVAALQLAPADLGEISRAARERVLEEHTASKRAMELEAILEGALFGSTEPETEVIRNS